MTAPTRDALPPVDALSPVDGRYRAATAPLRGLLSEAGLIRARIAVEAKWLLHLAASVPQLAGSKLPAPVRDRAALLAREPDAGAAEAVKVIESKINHDVKAVEYYVREQLAQCRRRRGHSRVGSLRMYLRGYQQPELRHACCAKRAPSFARRSRHGSMSSQSSHIATPIRRCWRARTDNRRAPQHSARNSRTSLPACGVRSNAGSRSRSSGNGTARSAISTRT